jgi:predicted thioesterase
MKAPFGIGDKKIYRKVVTKDDQATFHGSTLHAVCSTFALARDMEWSSRLFFIEMKEDDEEGVGTHLSIDHAGPAFVGEELVFEATIEKMDKNELICSIVVSTSGRVIATGKTGQKMLKKDKLKKLFRQEY